MAVLITSKLPRFFVKDRSNKVYSVLKIDKLTLIYLKILRTVLIPELELLGIGQTNLECASTFTINATTTTTNNTVLLAVDLGMGYVLLTSCPTINDKPKIFWVNQSTSTALLTWYEFLNRELNRC